MSIKNKYFRRAKKTHIDENDREINEDLVDYKKYSKGVLYAGTIGLGIATLNYFFTGEPTLQTLAEQFNQMNPIQRIDTAIFDISSFSYFGGGFMYTFFSLLKNDHINSVRKKIRSRLEKGLED